ncbi:MAG: ABC transporter substrate-binding protein, partial [Deltaproteobacteria bacterium]|nr:ABC transporter substrate-binding protein [Deltaproteobacteria bacterium]
VREVIHAISQLGEVCGVPETGERCAGELSRRLERVLGRITSRGRPLVLVQINLRPIMTVNKNTLLHDLIRLAGGENMTRDEPVTYPRISIEEVIRRKPEVIIITSMERAGGFEEARMEWFKWKSIPAVLNNRVHLIDSNLVDRASPRILRGLEVMAGMIHPEADWE